MTIQRTVSGALAPVVRRSLIADFLDGAGRVSIVREALGVSVGAITWFATFAAASGLPTVPLSYQIAASTLAGGAAMWFANQLVAFLRRHREGFAWGLAYEGLVVAYESGGNGALQLGVAFRNVTARPITYHVERFDVIVANRTLTNPTFANSGGVIPLATVRHFRAPSFPHVDIADFVGKKTEATIEFVVSYGAPGHHPVRQLAMRLAVTLNLTGAQAGAADIISAEADEPV